MSTKEKNHLLLNRREFVWGNRQEQSCLCLFLPLYSLRWETRKVKMPLTRLGPDQSCLSIARGWVKFCAKEKKEKNSVSEMIRFLQPFFLLPLYYFLLHSLLLIHPLLSPLIMVCCICRHSFRKHHTQNKCPEKAFLEGKEETVASVFAPINDWQRQKEGDPRIPGKK